MNTSESQSHSEFRDALGGFLEGDLDSATHADVERHLARCAPCSEELAELRRTIALLRGLPDPEPPPNLTAAVMARIADGESRSPVARLLGELTAAARSLLEPRLLVGATALGMAALVWMQVPEATRAPASATVRPLEQRSSLVLREAGFADLTRSFFGPGMPEEETVARIERHSVESARLMDRLVLGTPATGTPTRDLDRQLSRLKENPAAFLDRLAAVSAADQQADRLARRAAERGDGPQVALRVRQSRHPLAGPMSARFLAATLEQGVERRLRSPSGGGGGLGREPLDVTPASYGAGR